MTAVERGSASLNAKVTSFGRGAAPSNALGSHAVLDITICLRPSRRGVVIITTHAPPPPKRPVILLCKSPIRRLKKTYWAMYFYMYFY